MGRLSTGRRSRRTTALDAVVPEHGEANDRLATVSIALEDIDVEVAKFEGEIDSVRRREDTGSRDARLGDGQRQTARRNCSTSAGDAATRQSSLEDSLLEVMERREELQSDQTTQLSNIDELQSKMSAAQSARDGALMTIEQSRHRLASASRPADCGNRCRSSRHVRTSTQPWRAGRGTAAGTAVRRLPDRDRPRGDVPHLGCSR